MSSRDRFYAKAVENGNGCLVWVASLSPTGYGKFRDGHKHWRSHRWAWAHENGEIPEGMQVDHLCNNRACVNTEHMRLATPRENSTARHSAATARVNLDKTNCPRGHDLVDWNLNKSNKDRNERACKACNLARSRNRYRGRPDGWWKQEADRLFQEFKVGA